MTPQERASLWVRYLGGTELHCAEVFPIPTNQVPVKVDKLKKRGDIAEIWYMAGTEFDRRNANAEYIRTIP